MSYSTMTTPHFKMYVRGDNADQQKAGSLEGVELLILEMLSLN